MIGNFLFVEDDSFIGRHRAGKFFQNSMVIHGVWPRSKKAIQREPPLNFEVISLPYEAVCGLVVTREENHVRKAYGWCGPLWAFRKPNRGFKKCTETWTSGNVRNRRATVPNLLAPFYHLAINWAPAIDQGYAASTATNIGYAAYRGRLFTKCIKSWSIVGRDRDDIGCRYKSSEVESNVTKVTRAIDSRPIAQWTSRLSFMVFWSW